MSDTTSSGQPAHRSPGREGGGSGKPPEQAPSPVADDQPTVISRRRPVAAASGLGPQAQAGPSDLPPGARLGQFELLEYVGGGGMGRVFRATDTHLGRTVALKILSPDQAENPETLMRFRNEARSAARLNHEGIAQVYCLGEDNGLPYIAFEFIEGTNVRDLVARRGPLPLGEALRYTIQVAEALTHAAARNVVHRDIKPSNVLITSEGRAKLIDMGLARMQRPSTAGGDLTTSGVTLGTFDYISPEQARDPRNADERSDIYSLGCTLFFMLTGRPPFPEGTVLQKLLQHQEIEPPDVRQFRPDLSESVCRVLRKMMAKEPRLRHPRAAKLAEALLLLAEEVGIRPLAPANAPWAARQQPKASLLRRHLPWVAPIATLLAVVTWLHVLWAPPKEDDSWSAAWANWTEQPADGSQRPAGSPISEQATSPAKTPSGGLANGTGSAAGPSESILSKPPTEPLPGASDASAYVSAEEPGRPQQAAAEPPWKPAGNPLQSLLATYPRQSGLHPGAFRAGMSLPNEEASGFSMRSQPDVDRAELSRAAGPPANSAGAAAKTEPRPGEGKPLVVDPTGQVEHGFGSLSAACAAAGQGDVVELRYNGRRDQEPVELANLELTIRAADGFRPVVGFRPSQLDPIKYSRSMFTLIGSRLTLANLAIDLDLPRDVPSDSWSLFEIGQAEKVKLERCWLTVRNASDQQTAYHQDVSVFRVRAPPGMNLPIEGRPAARSPRVSIDLTDCVIRGEAVCLRIEDLHAMDLTWQNGLLATTEHLLVAEAGERLPVADQSVRIDLRDVTAVVGRGLFRLNHGEFAPHQLPIHVGCTRSLLIGSAKASLLEQAGVTDMKQAFQQIQWTGDRNFFEGFGSYWTVHHLDPEIYWQAKTFDDWQSRWHSDTEKQVSLGIGGHAAVTTRDRPGHSLTPADYAWINAALYDELAVQSPGEPEGVGLRIGRLPPGPPPEAALDTISEP